MIWPALKKASLSYLALVLVVLVNWISAFMIEGMNVFKVHKSKPLIYNFKKALTKSEFYIPILYLSAHCHL